MSLWNLQSKLERAIVAYLISQNCGTANDIFPLDSSASRSYPNTTVIAQNASPETLGTGVMRIPVLISIKGSAALDQNSSDVNVPRIVFETRVAATGDALIQMDADSPYDLQATADDITTAGNALATTGSSQSQLDNADMADFTLQTWIEDGFGRGTADSEGCSWERVLKFIAVCSPSAIS